MTQPTPPPIDLSQGIIDELQAWYLALCERDGLVYTQAIRYVVAWMYIQRDFLAKRQAKGQTAHYDWLIEQQLKSMAWLIQQVVRFAPDELKSQPEPPRPPRERGPRSPRGSTNKKKAPIWNGQLKKGWSGPTLPPEGGKTMPE